MQEKIEDYSDLYVIKRDGRKTSFNPTKIEIAIKKGFDSIREDEKLKYGAIHANEAFNETLKTLTSDAEKKKFTIEEIQDCIQNTLKELIQQLMVYY